MADSLAVRRKKEQDKRIQQITRGQTLSVRRPGVFERIYDYIDQPLAALAKRLGMSEADAYEYSKRLSGAVEGLTGADATEMSARRVSKGKGDTGDYINLGMAVLPGAIGAGAKKAKTALRGAKAAKEAKFSVKALPAPPKALALPAPGPSLPPHATKPKGGQWWPDKEVDLGGYTANNSPEAAARTIFQGRFPDLNPEIEPETEALRKWFERALPRYIKNELGTPDDPLRNLAEQGLLHVPDLSPEGWSSSASSAIMREPIGEIMFPKNRKGGMPGAGNDYRGGVLSTMPWLAKAPVTDELYGVTPRSLSQLGIPHVIDEMQNALYAEHFGLPAELAVRPESLDRMSFAAAVERAGRINKFRVKQMEETALKNMSGPAIHTFKEYPENNPLGLRWVELKAPDEIETPEFSIKDQSYTQRGIKIGDDYYNVPFNMETGSADYEGYARDVAKRNALQEALKYEGDTMGHCVGGYCPDVMSGRSRIFSLRDAKGEPHVTIETQPSSKSTAAADHLRNLGVLEEWQDYWKSYPKTSNNNEDIYDVTQQFLAARDLPPVDYSSQNIIQIKGKQNRAPKDDYLPFVQDFVKSQQWGNVGDIGNTGLVQLPDGRYITQQQWREGLNSVVSPWRNPGQYDERYLNNLSKAEWEYMAPYFEGFAIGGRVERDRCFCRHPMAAK